MDVLADANIFLAVLLNESQKESILDLTKDAHLISPVILPYEIGNALTAMKKRNRLDVFTIEKVYRFFLDIPVRLVESYINLAIQIACENNIYAYDAYYLDAANRHNIPLLTLDTRMQKIAKKMSIRILEVPDENL